MISFWIFLFIAKSIISKASKAGRIRTGNQDRLFSFHKWKVKHTQKRKIITPLSLLKTNLQ